MLAIDEGLAIAFVSTVAGMSAQRTSLPHRDGPLLLEAVDFAVVHGDALESRLADAAGIIIVAQHTDSAGLEPLRRLHARLPGDAFLPEAHALHRDPGHSEFKLNCPHCGQKLWVNDNQEGRPGRCPGCKKTFLIPSQPRHLAASLQLSSDSPVRLQTRGDTVAAIALVNELADRITRADDTVDSAKSTTMRIVIDDKI